MIPRSLSSIVLVLVSYALAGCTPGDAECRCTGAVPTGSVSARCGETQCVGGTEYTCMADDTVELGGACTAPPLPGPVAMNDGLALEVTRAERGRGFWRMHVRLTSRLRTPVAVSPPQFELETEAGLLLQATGGDRCPVARLAPNATYECALRFDYEERGAVVAVLFTTADEETPRSVRALAPAPVVDPSSACLDYVQAWNALPCVGPELALDADACGEARPTDCDLTGYWQCLTASLRCTDGRVDLGVACDQPACAREAQTGCWSPGGEGYGGLCFLTENESDCGPAAPFTTCPAGIAICRGIVAEGISGDALMAEDWEPNLARSVCESSGGFFEIL